MKWVSQDLNMYLSAKEYVDTAVVPLLPISFAGDIKETVAMTEFINLLSVPLERQFKGRMFFLPGFTYLTSFDKDQLIADVLSWEKELFAAGFAHVFFLTSDSFWRSVETQLEAETLWIPSIPLSGMDESYKNTILDNQVKQLLKLFMEKWQENDKLRD